MRIILITNDRSRDDHSRAGAEGLGEAEEDEPFDGGHKGAAERRNKIDRDPDVERDLATNPISQGSVENLANGQSDEIGGERELNRRERRFEVPADPREGRKIHVDGKWTESRQCPKEQDENVQNIIPEKNLT